MWRFLLPVASLCLAIASPACVRKVEGVWLQPLGGGSQRVWFAMRGTSVVAPDSWEAKPPSPLMRARLEGRAPSGMAVTCMWQVIPIAKELGLKPEALLDGELSPEELTKDLEDESISHVRIEKTERTSVAGHPASHFFYTADWTGRGMTGRVEMSVFTVPYMRTVFVSHCGTLAMDFPSVESEIVAVQRSLRRYEELRSDDAEAGGGPKHGSHRVATAIVDVVMIGCVLLGGIAAPRFVMRSPRAALDVVIALALFEGTMAFTMVGVDYFGNEALLDRMILPAMIALAPLVATLGAGLSILLLPRGASRWSGVALVGASLLSLPLVTAIRPVCASFIYPLIDKLVA